MDLMSFPPRNSSDLLIPALLEAVAGLVFYWTSDRLLAHSGLEAAPLDHETVDDAVKYRAVVETAVDVLNEIRDRLGSLVGIELERETAHAGLEFHARILRPCAGHCQQEEDQRRNAMHVDAPGRWILFGRRRNGQKPGSDRSLVDDAPASVFVQPVLALLHRIRQIIRPILLVEAHQHQSVPAGISEHAEVAHLDVDPGLAAVHEALVPAPAFQVLIRSGEILRIMREVAFRVEAFPVGPPLFQLLSERCSLACPFLGA